MSLKRKREENKKEKEVVVISDHEEEDEGWSNNGGDAQWSDHEEDTEELDEDVLRVMRTSLVEQQNDAYQRSSIHDQEEEQMRAAIEQSRQQQRKEEERRAKRRRRAVDRLEESLGVSSGAGTTLQLRIGGSSVRRIFNVKESLCSALLQWAAVEITKHSGVACLPCEVRLFSGIGKIKISSEQNRRSLHDAGIRYSTLFHYDVIDPTDLTDNGS